MNDTYRWPQEGWSEKEDKERAILASRDEGNENWEADLEILWENED